MGSCKLVTETMARQILLTTLLFLAAFSYNSNAEILSATQIGNCDTDANCFVEVVIQTSELVCLLDVGLDGKLVNEKVCQGIAEHKRSPAGLQKRWSSWDALIHPI